MRKRSVIFSVTLFLGVCFIWPWAIRQKSLRLEAEQLERRREKGKPKATAEMVTMDQGQTSPKQPVQIIFPVKGRGLGDIVSYFGDPRAGGKRKHEGVDIAAPRGTAVLAVADGIVDKVKEGGSGGRQVWLVLDNGWEVYYAHLNTQLVKQGDLVKAGDLIGTVGNTGNAINAGPHLHFCLYPSRQKPVNPLLYLPGQLSLPQS